MQYASCNFNSSLQNGERQRQRDRETERDRQTDRQADRQAGRQTDRQAGRQTERVGAVTKVSMNHNNWRQKRAETKQNPDLSAYHPERQNCYDTQIWAGWNDSAQMTLTLLNVSAADRLKPRRPWQMMAGSQNLPQLNTRLCALILFFALVFRPREMTAVIVK